MKKIAGLFSINSSWDTRSLRKGQVSNTQLFDFKSYPNLMYFDVLRSKDFTEVLQNMYFYVIISWSLKWKTLEETV